MRHSVSILALSLLLVSSLQANEKQFVISKADLGETDLATIQYVERTHLQLDRWGASLVSRIEQHKGPRQSNPVLDGRYSLAVKKLRRTYAGMAQSPQLAAAIHALADTHERRLQELERTLRSGVDRQQFSVTTVQASRAMNQIRGREL